MYKSYTTNYKKSNIKKTPAEVDTLATGAEFGQ